MAWPAASFASGWRPPFAPETTTGVCSRPSRASTWRRGRSTRRRPKARGRSSPASIWEPSSSRTSAWVSPATPSEFSSPSSGAPSSSLSSAAGLPLPWGGGPLLWAGSAAFSPYFAYGAPASEVVGPGTIRRHEAAFGEAEGAASGAAVSAGVVGASAGGAPAGEGELGAMKVPRRLRQDLTEENLDAIAAAVDAVESHTSGAGMVHVVHNLLPLEKPRARALRAFFDLGVNRTRDRNGVLLFVAMKKRLFEIVAAEALHAQGAG